MKEFRKANQLIDRSVVRVLITGVFLSLTNYTLAKNVICQVSDPHDPTLNVRNTPGGAVINRLQNERIVQIQETKADATGRVWAKVAGELRGDIRDWGWVFRSSLRCVDTDKFPTVKVSVAALAAAGIVSQNAQKIKQESISCNMIPNGWGVSISDAIYGAYRRRGFSETALCFGLGGLGVHFDPATGRQLPLYRVPVGLNIGDVPRPLWLSDCYKNIQILGPSNEIGQIPWRPTGCAMRYHPRTGQPITKPELVELAVGGPAGGGVDEDNQSSTVSEDRLQSLINGK